MINELIKLKLFWFKADRVHLTALYKIRALVWLLIFYSPFIYSVQLLINNFIWGYYNLGFVLVSLYFLFFALFFQAASDFGVFPRWDLVAKVLTFPMFLLYVFVKNVIVWSVNLMRASFIYVFTVLFQLAGVGVLIFLILGFLGLMLFGVRQIFNF